MAFSKVHFKKGIMVSGDVGSNSVSDQFYIIQQGKIVETHQFPRLNGKGEIEFEKQIRVLEQNDFLGVISCMSSRPWISFARALEDSSAVVIAKSQFTAVYKSFPDMALRIVRYFSEKLRNYNERLSRIPQGVSSFGQKPSDIFELGEYYFANYKYDKALYAYSSYLRHCPGGDKKAEASYRISQLKMMGTSLVAPNQIACPNGALPRRNYVDDSIVFLENEEDDKFYIIEEGSVAIKKFSGTDEKLLAVLKKGDMLGEMAVIDHKPRSASAFTIGNTSLTMITEDSLHVILQNSAMSTIIQRWMETICERIWIASRQLFDFMLQNPVERIYATLCTECCRLWARPSGSLAFNFGLSKLFEFINVKDPFNDVQEYYTNNRVFSAAELLADLRFSSACTQNAPYAFERIFTIHNGNLACLDVQQLFAVRESLVNAASSR